MTPEEHKKIARMVYKKFPGEPGDFERDKRIVEYFLPLGFEISEAQEFEIENQYHNPILFKTKDDHLYLTTSNYRVLKIHEETALKILAIGLP
jgi:hypothetical protein